MTKFMKLVMAVCTVFALAGAACGAQGDEDSTEDDGTATTVEDDGGATTTSGDSAMFGDLASPCGEGDTSVEQAESGGSTDSLRVGVANDRTSTIRPGLNKEMWDSSVAFVAWCNEQGGIGGIPIEIVDLDGKLLEVETSMAAACKGVFMMAGGGQVQDNLQFTGKAESDFHKCKMADIPGFAVSPEKSESNGQIQPIPHPADSINTGWLRDFKELHPEEAESMVEVWGDLPAMESTKNQTMAIIEGEGVEDAGVISYPVTGLSDWTPLAQQIIETEAESMHFVGEPTNLGALVKSLREQGWDGYPVVETNIYDQSYIDSAGAENAAGTIIRSAFHPFEEADKWPAVQQYLDILNENVDDAKIAQLGTQSFSGWLLFATAANNCAESNDGVLTRACVLEAAADVDDWTAGGLHGPTDPGPEGGEPGPCGMLLQVNDAGEFERLYPEIGSDEDDQDGFTCHEDANVDVPTNEGLGVTSPDQPI